MFLPPEPLSPVTEYGRPVAVILGGIISVTTVGWWALQKLRPILGQNYRDKELAVDFDRILAQYRALQARHDQMIYHSVKMESHVRTLSSCVIRLASITESLARLFPALLEGRDNMGPFLALVGELTTTAGEMKEQAEKASILANEDILAIQEKIASHTIAPEVRRETDPKAE